MIRFVTWFLIVLSGVFPAGTFACPRINQLVDFNCDGMLKIVVTGDSIVRGRGDTQIDDLTGGYVRVLKRYFPRAVIENMGIPGITSGQLLRQFKKNAPRGGKTFVKLHGADYILVEVGTNDYWLGVSRLSTVRNISRLRSFFRDFHIDTFGVAPLISTSTLPPTSRVYQEPFIASLNSLLLSPHYAKQLNVLVRFDGLPKELLSYDGLHPADAMYAKMAKIVALAVRGPLKSQALARRLDDDQDGVYDLFETTRFHTDPALLDTDGDGSTDGAEIFSLKTDPLVAELEPLPSPPPVASPTVPAAP